VGDSADCGHAVERRQGKLTDGSRDNTLMTRMSISKTAHRYLVEPNVFIHSFSNESRLTTMCRKSTKEQVMEAKPHLQVSDPFSTVEVALDDFVRSISAEEVVLRIAAPVVLEFEIPDVSNSESQ
jgi:hypothetical protein